MQAFYAAHYRSIGIVGTLREHEILHGSHGLLLLLELYIVHSRIYENEKQFVVTACENLWCAAAHIGERCHNTTIMATGIGNSVAEILAGHLEKIEIIMAAASGYLRTSLDGSDKIARRTAQRHPGFGICTHEIAILPTVALAVEGQIAVTQQSTQQTCFTRRGDTEEHDICNTALSFTPSYKTDVFDIGQCNLRFVLRTLR